MRDEKTLYWIWLSERCGAASKEFGRLIEKYDDPFDVYSLEEEEIEHLEGIGNALKGRLCDKSLESADAVLELLHKSDESCNGACEHTHGYHERGVFGEADPSVIEEEAARDENEHVEDIGNEHR